MDPIGPEGPFERQEISRIEQSKQKANTEKWLVAEDQRLTS